MNGHGRNPDDLKMLIKFLGMTRSSNDNEASVAMRKANEHLDKLKTTWEELLRGKVTIVADPFSGVQEPPMSRNMGADGMWNGNARQPSRPQAAPAPRPQPAWTAPAAPQPAPRHAASPGFDPYQAQPTPQASTQRRMTNKFPGVCHKCGNHVIAGAGEAVLTGYGSTKKWITECLPGKCATSKYGRKRMNVDDLGDMLS